MSTTHQRAEDNRVVDTDGNVYCRRHGSFVDSEYEETLAAYENTRRAARKEVLDALLDGDDPLTGEEIAAVRAEWRNGDG
jgi:hypothetical protein